jgi:hypothetical protein
MSGNHQPEILPDGEFAQRLGEHLRAGVADVTPSTAALLSGVRKHYGRRMRTRRITRIAVPAMVAAAAVAVPGAIALSSTTPSQAQASSQARPVVMTDAYVSAKLTSALTAASADVLHLTGTAPVVPGVPAGDPRLRGAEEEWQLADGTKDLLSRGPIGKPTQSWLIVVGGTDTSVDYTNHTYSTGPDASTAAANAPTGLPTAAEFKQALASGTLKITNKNASIGGKAAIEMVGAVPTRSNPTLDDVTYYVDASTYLPIQIGTSTPPPGGIVVSLQWLPATAANTAHIALPIPAGFTRK